MVLSATLQSQTFYEAYETKLDAGKSLYDQQTMVDSIILAADNAGYSLEAAEIAHNFSIKFYRIRDFEKAIAYGQIEIDRFEARDSIDNTYNTAVYNMGRFHYRNNDFRKSIRFMERVIEINIDPRRVAQAYCQIGRTYNRLGDYYKAIDFYDQGLALHREQKNYDLLVDNYINLSLVYKQINTPGSLSSAEEILDKASALKDSTAFSAQDLYTLNNGYATLYSLPNFLNVPKASAYFRRNLTTALAEQDSLFVCASYLNLSDLYNEIKSDSALHYANLGLQYSTDAISRSVGLHQISKYHFANGDPEEALSAIHESLVENTGQDDNINSVPSLDQLELATYKNDVLLALRFKADILMALGEIKNDNSLFEEALSNVRSADALVDLLQDESTEQRSKLLWREEATQLYARGIAAARALNEEELAFHFAEKSKALLLTESILQNADREALPDPVRRKESDLKKDLLRLEQSLSKTSDASEIQSLKDSLFDAKRVFRTFSDSIRDVFPNHFVSHSKTKTLPVSTVQSELGNHDVLLSYNWIQSDVNDITVHGIMVTKDQVNIFEVDEAEFLNDRIVTYRNLLSKPFETTRDKKAYCDLTFDLFKSLLPLDELGISPDGKHLIIIPDGPLQSIPFESLVSSPDDCRYLIEDAVVSYAYSMSFLLHNKSLLRNPTANFIGFAPAEFSYDNLESLPNTRREVDEIATLASDRKLLESEASKTNFLDEVGRNGIIHLATHANSGEHPWIAFYDEKVELHELYTLPNEADMVVLSACNTSLGEVAQGEGTFSLARGFFYSGANSVVSTLWNVNDKSGTELMKGFYSNLKKGQTKARALHNAKLEYLETRSLSDASPHYWASYVLVGDYGTSSLSSTWSPYWYLLLGLIPLGIYTFRRSRS